jgi:hypothetical protein
MEGAFLYTLTLTDVATTWTECLPLLHRTQHGVVHALQRARGMFSFPLLGIETDNGGEFLNDERLACCASEHLTFTRGRVANTNDQCYVEQKNRCVVRQLVGYDRFQGERPYRQLAELCRAVRKYSSISFAFVPLRCNSQNSFSFFQRVRAGAYTEVLRTVESLLGRAGTSNRAWARVNAAHWIR